MKIVESLISRFLKLDFLQLHPKCEQYFMLLIGCLEKLTEEEFSNITNDSLVKLKDFPSAVFCAGLKESTEKDFNCIIYGALRCKSLLLKKFPATTEEQRKVDAELVDLLVR